MARRDAGKAHRDAADLERMTIKQRCDTQLGVTSPEVVAAMRQEQAFLASVPYKMPVHRFTDRRPPPGRTRLIP